MLASLNCDIKLGIKEKCPNCGLFHLRPGYCWKLDPRYPPGHKLGDEIDETVTVSRNVSRNVTETVTPTVTECEECGKVIERGRYCSGACRQKAYRKR